MTAPTETARAWVDVDLDALVANARTLAAWCDSRLLPMVKANGYGLGAVRVARALESLDPWGYGVATLEEGLVLRDAGLGRPILVVSPLTPDALEPTFAAGFRPAIGDSGTLRGWLAHSQAPFHLEIDTGMSRGGIRWTDADTISAAARALAAAPGWEGAFTHFHSADTDESSIVRQWERFQAVLARLPCRPPLVHAANSAAALYGRAYAADLARPGIFLYGGEARAGGPAPRPVAALRARVVAVRAVAAGESVSYGATWTADRATTIATLGIGYADGYRRALSNRGEAIVNGKRVPVAGLVTMDMTMLDVTDAPCAVGDVATLIGHQGDERIDVADVAKAGGLSPYELLTGLRGRLPRRYVGDA
jgi:alanine racemase